MFTLTTDNPDTHRTLMDASGAFNMQASTNPFGFRGSVSFLELRHLQAALSLLPTDELIGVPK